MVAERGIVVVPLQVVIGAQVYDEVLEEGATDGATPAMVAEALKEFRPVSTSRPTPSALLEVYEQAAAEGATEIVSIHLSGEMSGTFESAQLAAQDAPVPVHCRRQPAGRRGDRVRRAVGRRRRSTPAGRRRRGRGRPDRAARATSLFYVDTLEYLRRGGRIGAAAAIFGGALSVKPLLKIADGRVANLEKVRTAGKALNRLEELVLEAAGDDQVDVCVAHLASHDRAEQLAERLAEELADNLGGREVWCTELGAVLGAHVGPGMVAVCVAPLLDLPLRSFAPPLSFGARPSALRRPVFARRWLAALASLLSPDGAARSDALVARAVVHRLAGAVAAASRLPSVAAWLADPGGAAPTSKPSRDGSSCSAPSWPRPAAASTPRRLRRTPGSASDRPLAVAPPPVRAAFRRRAATPRAVG